jgi:pantoate--beta-alanine ligase
MQVTGTFAETRALASGTVGLVPTMGFLHEGHLLLIDAARSAVDTVVMSLYVNPLQFEEQDDLARYPRDLDRDLGLAERAGVDVVFAPESAEMFAASPATRVDVPDLAIVMEGAHRPGHFQGVATVVTKLFAGLQPDLAYFGRKDAQQLAVVRRLAADLSFPVEVVGRPIIREKDGLALSSRNVFLDAGPRRAALSLQTGLMEAAELAEAGEQTARALENAARSPVAVTPGIDLEYATVATQDDVTPIARLDRPAFLAVAARVGDVRLIDNVHLDIGPDGIAVDRGVRLTGPSSMYEER